MPHSIATRLEVFLSQCELSSNHTVSHFEHLLTELEQVPRVENRESRQFLVALMQFHANYARDDFLTRYNFTFIKIDLSNRRDDSEPLALLQFPSTFTPEEWSYTFFEGLSRYEFSAFNNKRLVELGCGNGWITIGLAKRYQPAHITGLDINPRAIVASKINLHLNAMDEQGELIQDDEGKSLLDKVDFFESDLLGKFKPENKPQAAIFDAIVGCIPQVLSPSEDMFDDIMRHTQAHSQSDEFLHSLSNYCGKQGYIEDQFGLGLIAKAIEQSIDLLKPSGKIIFNLGGRPGAQVLERLVQRRGLTVQKIWQRRVIQAEDTDIDALVEIEGKSLHRFEFFLGLTSMEPISAKTAQAYLQRGGKISHALSVYEFTINQHHEIANIFNLLKEEDFKSALNGLDLAYANQGEAEEKIHFLSNLSLILKNTPYFPYAATAGEDLFRDRLAQFFDAYFYTNFTKDEFVVAPGRLSLVNNILHIYRPGLIIADRHFSKLAEIDQQLTGCNIIEAPSASHELCALIELIQPQLVITSVNEKQLAQADPFKAILAACEKVNARLIVDISHCLELSSNPQKIGILSYAAEAGLPAFCSIICGLTNNRVYQDLELCIFISEDPAILKHLAFSAEFTYSRAPLLTQLYYSELIFELLKFQMTNMRAINKGAGLRLEHGEAFIQPQSHVLEAFAHPSILGNTLPITPDTIRLDYGENELASSKYLKTGIFESFVRQHLTADEIDPSNEIRTVIGRRFGLNSDSSRVFFGNGVAPLFAALVKVCKAQHGTLVFPEGAYGYFYAATKFYDVPVKLIKTDYADSFKATPLAVASALKGVKNPFLFLNFPLVNPTGALYGQAEANQLFMQLAASNAHVIIDTVFSGLEFGIESSENSSFDLGQYIAAGLKYTLIGGISKEFSAGGLRFGYAMTQNAALMEALGHSPIDQPHSTMRHTVKKIYQLLIDNDASLLADLRTQQRTLHQRFVRLNAVLQGLGWKVLPPDGGLFLVASPEKYIGKTMLVEGRSFLLSSSNINEALYYGVGLLVNNDIWTGIPGYCRFVLSVEEPTFLAALVKLQAFDDLFMRALN